MFNVLTHAGDLHVWKRVKITGESTYTLGEEQIGNKILSNQNDTIGGMPWHYSSSVLVSSDGDISLVNEETITVNQNTVANGQNLVGKFAYPEKTGSGFSAGAVVFFPSNAVVTYTNGWTQISKYQSVTVVPPETSIDYPVSPNRNAYQEGSEAQPAGYTLGELQSGTFPITISISPNDIVSWNYGTEISVSDDGSISITGTTNTIGVYSNSGLVESAQGLIGKYAKPDKSVGVFSANSVYFFPNDTVVSFNNSAINISKYQTVTGYAAIQAGVTIEYMGQLGNKAQIETGSYVGTGKYGKNNPNTLTFEFVPKVVFIYENPGSNLHSVALLFPGGCGLGGRQLLPSSSASVMGISCIFNENSISWYQNYALEQFNGNGVSYAYIALG